MDPEETTCSNRDMEAWEYYDQSRTLPFGEQKVALLERVIEMTDADKDPYLGIVSRLDYADATSQTGASDRSLVAMAWLDQRYEISPEEFHDHLRHRFLWAFKSMCSDLVQYPNIPRSRIESFIDDFERRIGPEEAQTVAFIKMKTLTEMGDLAAAETIRQRYHQATRGQFDSCEACVLDFQVLMLMLQERPEDALKTAAPILQATMRCNAVPDSTYTYLLRPWMETGQMDLAEEKLKHVRKRFRKDPQGWVYNRSFVLEYYGLTKNRRSGIPFLEASLGEALADHAIDNKTLFCTAAVGMLSVTNPQRTMRLTRQSSLEWEDLSAQDLRDRLHTIAADGAATLDRRNGNDFFSRRLAAANESVL